MANGKRTSKNKAISKPLDRYEALQDWCDGAIKTLLLSDRWTVTVVPREADDENHAQIHMSESCNAELFVSSKFFFETSENQLKLMAHELCHLYFVETDHFLDVIDASDEQKKLYKTLINEPSTERVSRVIWRVLPKLPKLC